MINSIQIVSFSQNANKVYKVQIVKHNENFVNEAKILTKKQLQT